MHVTHPLIQEYCEQHTSPEPSYLSKLNRDTHAKVLNPRMLSGHLQGRLLAAFSKMINPSHILEIGTYTGYSTLCLAEGLTSGGSLSTIERNDELEPFHKAYFSVHAPAITIRTYYGDALSILAKLKGTFDLVFIDADKSEYTQYLEAMSHLIPSGAWIIADNVLWDGHVLEAKDKMSEETRAIDAFNKLLLDDAKFEVVMLPVRDGLSVIRKK